MIRVEVAARRLFVVLGASALLAVGAGPALAEEPFRLDEQIVDEDPTFDEVTLLPTTMKSVKVLTRFSNELARQSVIALDAALRNRLVTDVANVVDAAAVPLVDAVRAASTTPADALGLEDRGRLVAGCQADVVVLGPDLRAEETWIGGVLTWAR